MGVVELSQMFETYASCNYEFNMGELRQALISLTTEEKMDLFGQEIRCDRLTIHCVVIQGHVEVLECILNSIGQSRHELLLLKNQSGLTALHYACWWRHIEIIECILASCTPQQQIDLLNIPDNLNRTALHLAEVRNYEEVVRILHKYRTDADGALRTTWLTGNFHFAFCNEFY